MEKRLIMTVKTEKGLDADAVIVFGTPSVITEHQNDLLYVASSRARHILILLTHISDPIGSK
jgi:DNA helicase IV